MQVIIRKLSIHNNSNTSPRPSLYPMISRRTRILTSIIIITITTTTTTIISIRWTNCVKALSPLAIIITIRSSIQSMHTATMEVIVITTIINNEDIYRFHHSMEQ